jgi:hypothetical protein
MGAEIAGRMSEAAVLSQASSIEKRSKAGLE